MMFVRIVFFFKKAKEIKLANKDKKMTRFNLFIFFATLGIAILNLYHAIISAVLNYIAYFIALRGGKLLDFHNIHRFIIYSSIDMITAIGVLYLFYELD